MPKKSEYEHSYGSKTEYGMNGIFMKNRWPWSQLASSRESPTYILYPSFILQVLHARTTLRKTCETELLDVLTPSSDCRQESVERWNGDFGGFVYVLDRFPQRDFGLWVLYARLISVSFSGSLLQRRLPRPTALFSGYHAEGYHARTDAIKLTGYHVCRVTTPELPRSKQTYGYRQVITPAGSF